MSDGRGRDMLMSSWGEGVAAEVKLHRSTVHRCLLSCRRGRR
jgi:hypothetical protein